MRKIKPFIDDDYYDLIPRPTDIVRSALKLSIQREGQKDPIVVNKKGMILDGHTRFEICQELGIKCEFIIRKTKSRKEEINYSIITNTKRRNLNDFQLYELFEVEIDILAVSTRSIAAKRISSTKNGLTKKLNRDTPEGKLQRSLIAQAHELTGIGIHSISTIRFIKKHGDLVLQEEVRNGKSIWDAKRGLMGRNEHYVESKPYRRRDRNRELCPKCDGWVKIRTGCHVHKKLCCTKCGWGE